MTTTEQTLTLLCIACNARPTDIPTGNRGAFQPQAVATVYRHAGDSTLHLVLHDPDCPELGEALAATSRDRGGPR